MSVWVVEEDIHEGAVFGATLDREEAEQWVAAYNAPIRAAEAERSGDPYYWFPCKAMCWEVSALPADPAGLATEKVAYRRPDEETRANMARRVAEWQAKQK